MENQPVNLMIEKLRKLITHEKSAREIGNIHEAEAFAAKIQNLLTAHKLSMSEVEFENREQTEPIDWEKINPSDIHCRNKKIHVYWRAVIAKMIAKLNSCQVVNGAGNRSFYFVGRTSDREIAKMVYLYLIELGEELCIKCAKQDKESQSEKFRGSHGISDHSIPSWAKPAFTSHMKTYRESWKTGFGEAVSTRMNAIYQGMIRAQSVSSSNAIIHINRDALAVNEFLKGKIKKGHSGMSGNLANSDGYNRGKSVGGAINLSPNRFEGGSGRSSRLLGA